MEVNGPASYLCRLIIGVTASDGHRIMGWVGSRAGPGCVQRGVNGLSMYVAPSNGSGHCAGFFQLCIFYCRNSVFGFLEAGNVVGSGCVIVSGKLLFTDHLTSCSVGLFVNVTECLSGFF